MKPALEKTNFPKKHNSTVFEIVGYNPGFSFQSIFTFEYIKKKDDNINRGQKKLHEPI